MQTRYHKPDATLGWKQMMSKPKGSKAKTTLQRHFEVMVD